MNTNAPTNQRQRELLLTVTSRLSGIVQPSQIQLKTARVFAKLSNNDAKAVFDFRENAKVIKSCESLLRETRAMVGNELAVGIAQVPIINGRESFGNMRVISYPHPTIFPTATERNSVKMYFNGLLDFKTDQTTRLEKFPMSKLTIIDQQCDSFVPEVLCSIDTQVAFVLDGSKENTLTLNYTEGVYSDIEGVAATHVNYGICEFSGYEVICGAGQREAVVAALSGLRY